MPKALKAFPVIDLFAGPGGLGEGFASFVGANGEPRFESVAAIEQDEPSYQTLLLRHFLHQFPDRQFPDDYYRYLRREIWKEELYELHPAAIAKARRSALKISLGPENHALVQKIIGERLSDSSRWALVGGPPCQAYSLVGRSKMILTRPDPNCPPVLERRKDPPKSRRGPRYTCPTCGAPHGGSKGPECADCDGKRNGGYPTDRPRNER